jgi:hypothetical protein
VPFSGGLSVDHLDAARKIIKRVWRHMHLLSFLTAANGAWINNKKYVYVAPPCAHIKHCCVYIKMEFFLFLFLSRVCRRSVLETKQTCFMKREHSRLTKNGLLHHATSDRSRLATICCTAECQGTNAKFSRKFHAAIGFTQIHFFLWFSRWILLIIMNIEQQQQQQLSKRRFFSLVAFLDKLKNLSRENWNEQNGRERR